MTASATSSPAELGRAMRVAGFDESTAIMAEMQLALLRSREARGACVSPDHQHWTYSLVDGTQVGEAVALACWGEHDDGSPCARPAHWDSNGDLHHDDPGTPPCDMAEAPLSTCVPGT